MYEMWQADAEVFGNHVQFVSGDRQREIINRLNRYFAAYYNLTKRNESLQSTYYANPSDKELKEKYCAGVIFEYRSRQRLIKLIGDLFPQRTVAAIQTMLEQHKYDLRTKTILAEKIYGWRNKHVRT